MSKKLQKISRLNVTLSTLGYKVSVEGDQVHLFNPMKKYAGSMNHEDFQIWAIELTAERAITEYIMMRTKEKRLYTESDDDLYRTMEEILSGVDRRSLKTAVIANYKAERDKACGT
jgi:hypothetical protein